MVAVAVRVTVALPLSGWVTLPSGARTASSELVQVRVTFSSEDLGSVRSFAVSGRTERLRRTASTASSAALASALTFRVNSRVFVTSPRVAVAVRVTVQS